MVTFGVLGPLTAENEHGPVRLKGPRHRAVLARLLVARGRVVPVSWLIGDLWESPQEGALGAVQTFVGALRKALEPDRPPRAPSRLLVTSPPGYALRAEPGAVDAWRFESAVTDASRLLAEGAAAQAHSLLDTALGLWRGPAYAEFAELDWARGEAARLDELRLLAVERRAEAALARGGAAESVPDLEAHVAEHPLREDGWRLLALALYRAGRQGDALGQLRRAREVLRRELGVDPGEGLRRLESDILAHAPHLTPALPPNLSSARPSLGDGPPSGGGRSPAPTNAGPPASPSGHPAASPSGHPAASPSGHPAASPSGHPAASPSGHPAASPSGHPAASLSAHPAASPGDPAGEAAFGEHPFVGRAAELAELEGVAAGVTAAGRARLVLVSGAAGAGKTALAGTLARRLEANGWTTAWGASPELQGAPSAWPWTQIRERLATAGHAHSDGAGSAEGDSPLATRFKRHRAIAAHVAGVAERAPLLLVFDDLHWADEETLALLTTLATDLGTAPVLILGTYRSTEISAGLADALGRAARAEPARVYLGGLTQPQVRELVQAITGRVTSDGDARTIHTRSAGNPFFVRELTRLWESEGDAALHTTVPAGVRDVIRHRLAGLTETARTHLRKAAVLGQDVDLDVLIPLAGDEDQVLESVESALLAGFLVEQDADRLRFAHALVHETLYDDVTRARRARWHAKASEIVERIRPGDVETVAYHCVRAEGRAGATRTARYTRAAAQRAEARSAPHEAARLWRATLTALDHMSGPDRSRGLRSPDPGSDLCPGPGSGLDPGSDPDPGSGLGPGTDFGTGSSSGTGTGVGSGSIGHGGGVGGRLEAVMGLVRALAVIGELHESRRYRAEAVDAAEALGDPVVTAGVIGSFDVPAIWTANDDPALSARLVAAAERTLAALPPGGHDAERARLLITIAMERRADPDPRGAQAAREAEDIARRLGERTLLAYALNGRYMQTFQRAGLAPERAEIGEELVRLAAGHDGLVTFEVLGRLILLQSAAALAELEAADRHAAAADRLAERYDLPLVGVFTTWYAALRRTVTGAGGKDAARSAYRAAAARLSGTGMPGVEDGMLPLALLCLEVGADGPHREDAELDGLSGADWGPYESWGRPLVLLAQGRREEAAAAARAIPESPRDLLFEARTCLHALAAVETAGRPVLERLYERLLPAEGELAGAGSGLLTLGPVALYLGRLAAALGHRRRAAAHFRQAEALAGKAGAPHWAEAARHGLDALPAAALPAAALPTNGRTSDGRTSDGRTPDGRTPDGRTPDGRPAEGLPPEGRSV
ncbi:BTAD domain-containing putative transcriptional regulator [Nonomuraea sp. GTA35]|uniref:BTAD domain-containing putative transcriptional regulator n=1 Tax=Nonomuraea sp. GTA35 TaxID=1676746 RepID=UPI0035BF5DAE